MPAPVTSDEALELARLYCETGGRLIQYSITPPIEISQTYRDELNSLGRDIAKESVRLVILADQTIIDEAQTSVEELKSVIGEAQDAIAHIKMVKWVIDLGTGILKMVNALLKTPADPGGIAQALVELKGKIDSMPSAEKRAAMSPEEEVVEAIGLHIEEIKLQLGQKAADFQTRFQQLQALAQQQPMKPEAIGPEILKLYDDFPGVQDFMKKTAAPPSPLPLPPTPTPTPPSPLPPPSAGPTPPVGIAQRESEGRLQLLKEGVSSFLAVAVVVFTLGIALYSVIRVDMTNFQSAKDILMLLLGPFGTVLGYYFGRLPADARAAQAQDQTAAAQKNAAEAKAHADQVTDQSLNIANAANEVVTKASGTVAAAQRRGFAEDEITGVNEEVKRLQTETMKLLELARRR